MARSRNIKPSFFSNDQLVEMPYEYRLLFIGLWTLADREGFLFDRPKKIKMEIFPADNIDVDKGLQALHDSGQIRRYVADGVACIEITNFVKHQSPHYKEAESTVPKYDGYLGLDGQSSTQKPETLPSTIEPNALGNDVNEDAGQAPGKPEESPGQAALIPDSLNLIPDTGGGGGIETSTKKNTGAVDNSGTVIYTPFAMHDQWTPSDSFDSLAKSAGLVLQATPVAEMKEFRTYWLTQPNMRRTSSEWDYAFIKQLKANALKPARGKPPSKPNIAANSLYDPTDTQTATGGHHAALK